LYSFNARTHQTLYQLALLQNAREQHLGHHDQRFDETKSQMFVIVLHTDTTFNMIGEDWCQASVSARNNRRVRGKMTSEAMPICFLLSRTETGAGVANMFVDIRTFLLEYENLHFYWNVVVSDHHDGVISSVSAIEQGNLTRKVFPVCNYILIYHIDRYDIRKQPCALL
jgi:hypothetical protein